LHLARAAGVTTVRADLLAENRGAPRLLARLGLRCTATIEDGATRALARVPEEPGDGWAGAFGVAQTGDAQAPSRAPPTGQVRQPRRPGVAVGGTPQWPFASGTRG
jgi:hypothetical protein